MKNLTLLSLALFCLFSISALAGVAKERQWQLHSEKDGVQFYISVDQTGDGNAKTFLKVKNTNAYKVRISFSAIFPCRNNQKKTQNESLFVSPSGMAIYTYQVCTLGNSDSFELNNISIVEQ